MSAFTKRRQCQHIYPSGKQCSKLATMAGYCGRHFNDHDVELGLDLAETT